MGDTLEQKLGIKIQFNIRDDTIKIKMDGDNDSHVAKLDVITVDLKTIDLDTLEISKDSFKMDFKAPIICDKNRVNSSKSIIVGFNFEGQDRDKILGIIEEIARNFGPEWEDAVQKRKEEIKKRRIIKR